MRDIRQLLLNGEEFEYKVMNLIKAISPDVKLFHNRRIYSPFLCRDTQIDIVTVADNGVFIIEAKNWSGWLKGDMSDEKWSGQSLDRKVKEIYNPFHQNFIHIRAVRNAIRNLEVEPAMFYNLVVVPDCTNIYSDCKQVVNISKLPLQLGTPSERIDKQYYTELLERVLL